MASETGRPEHLAADEFHNHVERCERCRRQTFNLCPEGLRLLLRFGQLAGAFVAPV